MADFPEFLKSSKNRIASASQFTDDVAGWVFDGADGSQVALWIARADRCSKPHVHDFDEWVFVLEGRCTAILEGRRIELGPGEELLIPKGTEQAMEVVAGTRTLHAFGGKRAVRENA
jgi:ethanolamine utilization protein EutQ (cupin superfamily)